MTEFWQSKKQYWCKYCSIFIRDDKPSRSQHENGLRHQGNRERAIREVYKTGERAVRDKKEEGRMMERIDKAAALAHAQDPTQTASSSTSTLSAPAAPPTRKAPPKTDIYANYSTAASLGFVDPNAASDAAAAEYKEKREKEGFVGGWEQVKVGRGVMPELEAEAGGEEGKFGMNLGEEGEGKVLIRGSLDVPESEEAHNYHFDPRAKRMIEEDDGFDPEAILGKVKVKEETIMEKQRREKEKELDRGKGWGGVGLGGKGKERAKEEEGEGVKEEEGGGSKVEPEVGGEVAAVGGDEKVVPAAGGGMFKKRKAPAGGVRSVRQKN